MSHYHIIINPRYEHLRESIEAVIKTGMPAGSEVIYRGRNTLFKMPMGNVTTVVKTFKKPNTINAYVYTTLRRSKAERSYENAMKMQELGFLTPEPIAYGEIRHGAKLSESYYICVELPAFTEMRKWENNPDAPTLLPAFAREMWRLYQAGVWHKDFSPGNILYTRDSDGGYRFYYVDLNRMKFGVHDHKRLMRMFRAINTNMTETRRLGRIYAEVTGQDPDAIEREAAAQLESYYALQRKKRFFKRLRGKH